MTDLTEYAKRESARRSPDGAEDYHWRSGWEGGILHLASELQREDVIEAGMLAADDEFFEQIGQRINPALLRSAVAHSQSAMLAKIAEPQS